MTQILAEDQPILDEHGNVNLDVKKPALFKSQSIILTDEELKELGMKSDENAIPCEIAEEEEEEENGIECDEKPIQSNGDESNENGVGENNEDEEIDSGDLNHETLQLEDSNGNEQENHDNNDDTEETKNEVDQDVHAENEAKNEIDLSDDLPVPEPDVGAVEVESANEDNTAKETEKLNENKQKPRPISGHKFKIPPMWTPANPRANAAFVYIFFRNVGFY